MSTWTPSAASIHRERPKGASTLDEYAIREFLHTAYPRLVSAVGLVAGSRALAEDAVQEALARAWERSERGEVIRNLGGWVTAVALNLSRSWLRRVRSERRARERLGGASLGEPSPERVDVERAIGSLPRRQREAIVLRYYVGLDVREIAQALRLHEGTVKTTLHRARAALAERLDEPIDDGASDRER